MTFTPAQTRALALLDACDDDDGGWGFAGPRTEPHPDSDGVARAQVNYATAHALERAGALEARETIDDGTRTLWVRRWKGEGAAPVRSAAPEPGGKPNGYRRVPPGPVSIEKVVATFPTVRQSLLASIDDCQLSTWFELEYEGNWSTHPQARGTIFHRFAAECLRTMKMADSQGIPVSEALEILHETCLQHNVPPEEIVVVPTREIRTLRMAAIKFAHDNTFSIRNIVDVERRLEATLRYDGPDGEPIERRLTGQLDALIARGDDEAIVLDWKASWALPPKRDEDADDPGISYHGYFQQKMYAWLVLQNYPSLQAVALREFYVFRSEARTARVTRRDLPEIERELGYLVAAFDRCVASGAPAFPLKLEALEKSGAWKPSPGKHCEWCSKAKKCPIDDDYKGTVVAGPEAAENLAAVRQVAKGIIRAADAQLRPYAEANGAIPVKRSKGRLVLGFRKIKGGLRWSEFVPVEGDRPTTEDATPAVPDIEGAFADAAARVTD